MNKGTVINARYHRQPMELTVPRAKTTANIEPTAQNNWKSNKSHVVISTVHLNWSAGLAIMQEV